MQFHIYEEEYTHLFDKENMKVPTKTFGILRKQLVKNLGIERAQELLFHFGYEMGQNDVRKLQTLGVEKAELVKQGPILHIENGQIEGIIHQCEAKFDGLGRLTSIVGQGEWIGSFEASQHLNWFGPATRTVCSTLAGFASGFMSGVFNENLIAKELTCKARGDEKCTWIIKTQRQWELEADHHYVLQNATMIERELKDTYDQLLEQRDFIKKLFDFQKLLAEELLKGQTLAEISKLAVKFVGKPLCIKDKNLRTITYAGMTEREFFYLDQDFQCFLSKNDFDNVFTSQLKVNAQIRTIDTGRQILVTRPILIKGQLLAWVFFIYDKKRHLYCKDEGLFLEQFTNAIAMLLLNERTKFESVERMKGNFLDQLLSGTLQEKEILSRGLFTGVDFTNPYHIVAIEFKSTSFDTNNFELEEQLLQYFFDYFHEEKISALIGHRDGKLVLLLSNYSDEQIEAELERLIIITTKAYPYVKFKFGVSLQCLSPLEAPISFKQATVTLRLIFTKQLVFYSELGFISLLPKDYDLDWLRHIATKELCELSDYKKERNQEFLKTLYIFLINGGNLDKTKNVLNLSLSGLRHRIQNIEKMLGKDLRDPEVMYQLTFILKLLIISEELDFGHN